MCVLCRLAIPHYNVVRAACQHPQCPLLAYQREGKQQTLSCRAHQAVEKGMADVCTAIQDSLRAAHVQVDTCALLQQVPLRTRRNGKFVKGSNAYVDLVLVRADAWLGFEVHGSRAHQSRRDVQARDQKKRTAWLALPHAHGPLVEVIAWRKTNADWHKQMRAGVNKAVHNFVASQQ